MAPKVDAQGLQLSAAQRTLLPLTSGSSASAGSLLLFMGAEQYTEEGFPPMLSPWDTGLSRYNDHARLLERGEHASGSAGSSCCLVLFNAAELEARLSR